MAAGASLDMTTRGERQRERVARLLDQVTSAAEIWAKAEYEIGVDDGRHGLHSVHVARQRETAERRFRDIAARLSAAITPPVDPRKAQPQLPLG
jgi:hypothetical protein